MGAEFIGTKPDCTIGRSFAIDIAGWEPLWTYAAELCRDFLTYDRYDNGFGHDGHEFRNQEMQIIQRGRARWVGSCRRLPQTVEANP